MKNNKLGGLSLLGIGLMAGLIMAYSPLQKEQPITGRGSPVALQQKYESWKVGYENNHGAETLSLALGFSKAFSKNKHQTSGLAKINLLNGQVDVKLKGLEKDNHYAFWLIGGGNNDSAPVEKLVGRFQADSKQHNLVAQLDRQDLQGFFINRVVVTQNDQSPSSSELLSGSPSLFQRMYYTDLLWPVTGVGQLAKADQQVPFGFLLPKPAFARALQTDLASTLEEQIALGRDLFVNETFAGNGRTCETCHRLDNNHTIDPIYISTLPQNDPLFIAENNPDLAELENPQLLRQFGLIKANIDGFDEPGVFRGVPHLLALTTSITPEVDKEEGLVVHALGWSADGSPGDGSLRNFTIGAVMQHMTKTLDRVEDTDFRLPTDEELDAIEAYMLSLGRTHDPDLDSMFFSSPIVQLGRELFHSKEEGTGMCKGCHFNAGANSSTTLQNANRDTGVENQPNNLSRLVWAPTPVDGGFGTEPANDCGFGSNKPCFGNQEFNITTVIEAADTAPFFHNNSVNTIEEAVAFYNSNAFHASPGAKPIDLTKTPPRETCGRCIHLETTEVVSVALFLRTLNAMENIRSSNEMLDQVKQLNRRNGREILKLAIAETKDAIEVLQGGQIIANPESLALLNHALRKERKALKRNSKKRRNRLLNRAIRMKNEANDLLLLAEEAPAV